MESLRNIVLAGVILFGGLARVTDAQELFRNHFYNFNNEISEEINNPSCPECSNLIIKAQEGYELDEYEQKKVRGFLQASVGDYVADKLIEALKKSRLRKYVEPIEKVAKGVEVPVPRTKDKVKIKPRIDLDSESNLQGGLNLSYRNLGFSTRTDGELRARINFFKKDNKRLSIEAGYNEDLFLGLRFGIIY